MRLFPCFAFLAGCIFSEPVAPHPVETVADLGQLADGWRADIVAQVDQSYAGWDVEIADADGDGRPDVLTGTAPDSRLYIHQLTDGAWQSHLLVDRLAGDSPGIVLGVRVVDLDHDGRPEVIAGTGQEDDSVAQLAIMQTDGTLVTSMSTTRAESNTSSYTHGLPTADLDGDGMYEIVSAYCGHGEVIRYDVAAVGGPIRSHKVLQLSGSGEDSWLGDVDGDGDLELVVSNGFRDDAARVEIHDLDPITGDPVAAPRVVIDNFEGRHMFYASIAIGDIDGDGGPEVLVGWKAQQDVNEASLVAYHVRGTSAEPVYVLARDDASLDLGYFEKMIAIADFDGDGRNEVAVSTRGDGDSEGIDSQHLGHVFQYRVRRDGEVRRDLIFDLDPQVAESAWIAAGDVDGDARPDLVLATGKGDRELPGDSWLLRLSVER